MQSPSFLAYQRHLQAGHGRSNCEGLFGISQIPSDNHIRDMLDPADPALLHPMFTEGKRGRSITLLGAGGLVPDVVGDGRGRHGKARFAGGGCWSNRSPTARRLGTELSACGKRRRWTAEQKHKIVAEGMEPDVSAAMVAGRHGISTGQFYAWRQQLLLRGALDAGSQLRAELAGIDSTTIAPRLKHRYF